LFPTSRRAEVAVNAAWDELEPERPTLNGLLKAEKAAGKGKKAGQKKTAKIPQDEEDEEDEDDEEIENVGMPAPVPAAADLADQPRATGMAGSPLTVGPTAPPTQNRRPQPPPIYGPDMSEFLNQQLTLNAGTHGGPDILPMPTMNALLRDDPWFGRPRRGPVASATGRHSNDSNPGPAPASPWPSRGDGPSSSRMDDRRHQLSEDAKANWERLGLGDLLSDDYEGPEPLPMPGQE
jgi:hypothetical protein